MGIDLCCFSALMSQKLLNAS